MEKKVSSTLNLSDQQVLLAVFEPWACSIVEVSMATEEASLALSACRGSCHLHFTFLGIQTMQQLCALSVVKALKQSES